MRLFVLREIPAYRFLLPNCFAATDSCFFLATLFVLVCFCVACLCTDFGDLSPMMDSF